MPDQVVLDSSAALALLLGEPGGERVASVLGVCLLSTVNLAEVHSVLIKRGDAAPRAWDKILTLQCDICQFTPQQARTTAEFIPITQHYGLSLGDRACLALALERKAKVFTADRNWKNLSLGIEIEVIR